MSKRDLGGTGTVAILSSVFLLLIQAPVFAITGPIQTFEHGDALRGVVISKDGHWVASWPRNTKAKIWCVDSGAQKHLLSSGMKAMALSPDGKRFAQGTLYGAKLKDMASGDRISDLTGYFTSSVEFSADSSKVLYASLSNHKVELFSAKDGALIYSFPYSYHDTLYGSFSADGRRICTGGYTLAQDTVASVWDAVTLQEIRKITITGTPSADVGLSHNGETLLVATWNGAAALFSVATGEKICTLSENTRVVSFCAFSVDDTKIATWGDPSGPNEPVTGTLWNASTGEAITEFRAPAAFSTDGKYLVTGGDDQSAKVLDASTLETVHTFTGMTGGLNSAAFSANSQLLVLGGADKLVRVFYLGIGQPPAGRVDLINDPQYGEGPLLVAGMPVVAPPVQTQFTALVSRHHNYET